MEFKGKQKIHSNILFILWIFFNKSIVFIQYSFYIASARQLPIFMDDIYMKHEGIKLLFIFDKLYYIATVTLGTLDEGIRKKAEV